MVLILILYLFAYFLLAIIRIDWAVMFLIAALPAYLIRFDVLAVPFTLLEAMILISFAVWFFGNYKNIIRNIKNKLEIGNCLPAELEGKLEINNRYPFDIEIILLLIVSFAAAGVAGFSASAMGIWKAYFFEPALVFILVFNVFGKGFLPSFSSGFAASAADGDAKASRPELQPKDDPPRAEKLGRILWPLAVSAFAVSVFAIYQKFTGAFIFNELWAAEETRRVTSFFGYPNAVGLFLGPVIMILIGWMFKLISIIKAENKIFNFQFLIFKQFLIFNFKNLLSIILIGITVIISLLSIYFAKSEGAMIGIAAGLLVFGLLAGKKIRWAAVILMLLAVIGIINSQPASPWLQRGEPLRDYAVKKITLTDLSGEIRKQQWRETWQMMGRRNAKFCVPTRFIFGAGLANYQNAVAPYHQEGIFFNKDNDPEFHRHVVWDEEYKKSHWQPTEIYLYPHNIILNFWSELGLAGVLLFIWIIGKFLVIGIWNLFGHWSLPAPLRCARPGGFENLAGEKSNKFIVIGLMCSMIVIIVHGIVDVPYFKNDLAVMFWLLIAMMGLINLEKNYEENL